MVVSASAIRDAHAARNDEECIDPSRSDSQNRERYNAWKQFVVLGAPALA
jgi:hypothetical protein